MWFCHPYRSILKIKYFVKIYSILFCLLVCDISFFSFRILLLMKLLIKVIALIIELWKLKRLKSLKWDDNLLIEWRFTKIWIVFVGTLRSFLSSYSSTRNCYFIFRILYPFWYYRLVIFLIFQKLNSDNVLIKLFHRLAG